MNTLFLLSLSWLWADLTKSPHHICLSIAVLLVILWNIIRRFLPDSLLTTLFDALMLLSIGGFEIAGVIVFRSVNHYWYFQSLGNTFFSIGVVIVAFVIVISQFLRSSYVLEEISDEGGFENSYDIGNASVVVAIIAGLIVLFVAREYILWVLYAFVLFQAFIFVIMFVSVIRKGGSILLFLFSFII